MVSDPLALPDGFVAPFNFASWSQQVTNTASGYKTQTDSLDFAP